MIGYVAAGATEVAAQKMLSRLLRVEAGLLTVLDVFIGLATLLAGGYVAARIRPKAEDVMAAIVFLAVAGTMMTMPDSAPTWYALTFLVGGPAAAHTGGWLSRRRGSPPHATDTPCEP